MTINVKEYSTAQFVMTEDGDFVCSHEDAYIEKACCSGFEGGLPSCGCGGNDGIICPAWDCTDIQDHEIESLFNMLEPEEPDYDNYND